MRLDPSDAFVLAVAAHVEAFLAGNPAAAADMFERSLQLNKNSAFAWGLSAITSCYLGRPDDALERLRNAWRLSPFDPLRFFFWGVAGFAEFLAGRYEESLAWLQKSRRENPGHLACHRNLAACYAQLGRPDEARAAAADLIAREPSFRVSTFASTYPLRQQEHLGRLVGALRAAGLPE
jgi:tetratricopeptide (TPR) repeat protein